MQTSVDTRVAAAATPPRRQEPETRILLQPLAAPEVLGSFALASALIVYGTWFAGGWGTERDASSFFPFLLLFGGVGQLAAGLWAYRARSAVAAALHGSWGAFWLGIGLIYLLRTTHTIVVPARGEHWGSLGQWFIYMSVITWTTAFAALARSPVGFVSQALLGTASALAAAALIAPSPASEHVAGWLFVAAAAGAIYAGAVTMLDAAYGRTTLPLPGRAPSRPVQYERGDPGVKVGQ